MSSRIDYNNPHGSGELGLPYHYEMVSDSKRVTPFKLAIQKLCKDKIVIESGTGTGILSILAAKAGAKAVYAFELDPAIAAFAKSNFQKTGLNNLTLINKSTLESSIEDLNGQKADVVIAENLSTWLVTEPQIKVMNHMREFLAKSDAIFLPGQVTNYIELCHSQYLFEEVIELRTTYFEFTGIKSPEILSELTLYSKLNFNEKNEEFYSKTIETKAIKDGIVNSIRLTSPLNLYGDINFDQSDSLMPPVILPLEKDISVKKGQPMKIKIEYTSNTDWNNFNCTIA